MKSIRTKFILQFGALILAVNVILTGVGVYSSSNALLEENESAMSTFTVEISKSVASEIGTLGSELSFLANHPMLTNDETSEEDKAMIYGEEVETRGVSGFIQLDLDGTGEMYDIVTETIIDIDMTGEDFVDRALGGEEFTTIYKPSNSDSEMLLYVIPSTSMDTGELTGVFMAWIPLDTVSEIVADIAYGDSGFTFLVTDDGEVINGNETHIFDASLAEEGTVARILDESVLGIEYTQGSDGFIASSVKVEDSPFTVVVAINEDFIMSDIMSLFTVLALTGVVVLAVGSIITFLISNSISKPIVAVTKKSQELSDLVIRLDNTNEKVSKNELGRLKTSFSKIEESLAEIVGDVTNASDMVEDRANNLNTISDEIAEKSGLISMSVEGISSGVSEQAEDISKMMEDINELSVNIEDEQRLLDDFDQMAKTMTDLKDNGLDKVQVLVDKTEDNKEMVKQISDVIESTNDDALRISEAVTMIETIADQTSLLALNANIEAARAGEHGRGFAIVADEVRKLAEESERFAGEIKKTIDELTNKTQSSVGIMGEMLEFQEIQDVNVNETVQSFTGISDQILVIQHGLNMLIESGDKMQTKKESIVRAIENLSAISEENAATSQNILAIVNEQNETINHISEESESLNSLVVELGEVVGRFDLEF